MRTKPVTFNLLHPRCISVGECVPPVTHPYRGVTVLRPPKHPLLGIGLGR